MRYLAEIIAHNIVMFINLAVLGSTRWHDKRISFVISLQLVNIILQSLAITFFITNHFLALDAISISSHLFTFLLVAGEIKMAKIMLLIEDYKPRTLGRVIELFNIICTPCLISAEIIRFALILSDYTVPTPLTQFTATLALSLKIAVVVHAQYLWHDFLTIVTDTWENHKSSKAFDGVSPLAAMLTLGPLQLCI